jgi:hypothetical protein
MTGRVHDAILDPETATSLRDIVEEGGYYGMQTFDQALYEAFERGDVSMEEALRFATHPHDFKLLVSSDGGTATSMKDIDGGAPVSRSGSIPRSSQAAEDPSAGAGGSSAAPVHLLNGDVRG